MYNLPKFLLLSLLFASLLVHACNAHVSVTDPPTRMQVAVLDMSHFWSKGRATTSTLYDQSSCGSYLGVCYDPHFKRLFFTNCKLYAGDCRNCTSSKSFRYNPIPNINFTQRQQNRYLNPLALDQTNSALIYRNESSIFSFRTDEAPIVPRAELLLSRDQSTVINGFAIDKKRQWLYWTERSIDSVGCNVYTIMRKSLVGGRNGLNDSKAEVLYEHPYEMVGIDIDEESNTLFFTCLWFKPHGAVYRMDLDRSVEGVYRMRRITDARFTGFIGMPDVKIFGKWVLYSDYGLRRIFIMDRDGNYQREVAMLDYYPFGLSVDDSQQRVFVTAEATFFDTEDWWPIRRDEHDTGIQCTEHREKIIKTKTAALENIV